MKKSNLLSTYKTNAKREVEGSWFQLDHEFEFLIARQGGANGKKVNEAISKYYIPHMEKIKNKEISDDERDRITIECFVKACILDWRGVKLEDSEEDAPYDSDDMVDILFECPEILDKLTHYANNRNGYRDELGKS